MSCPYSRSYVNEILLLGSFPGFRTGTNGTASLSAAGAGGGTLGMAEEPALPPVQVSQLSATTTRLKTEVQAESTARPENTAQVVKTWLAED